MNSTGIAAKIRPYDGDDASAVISSVANRPRGRSIVSGSGAGAEPAYGTSPSASPAQANSSPRATRGMHGHSGSASGSAAFFALGHRRTGSGSNPSSLPAKPLAAALFDAANGGPSPSHHLANAVRAEESAHGPEALRSIQEAGGVLPPAVQSALAPSPLAANEATAAPLQPAVEIEAAQPIKTGGAGSGRIGDAGKVGA